jgi:hypothetical protein
VPFKGERTHRQLLFSTPSLSKVLHKEGVLARCTQLRSCCSDGVYPASVVYGYV